jgi:hypothetical protein
MQAVRGAGASTTSYCGAGVSTRPPSRWRWVDVDALAVGRRRGFVVSTIHELARRGWLESEDGYVRPTTRFPES